jgi:putative NADH-flavin reductase
MWRRRDTTFLGATGGTGRALVEQASGRGHRVTAFVRSSLGPPPTGVSVVLGDPRDKARLQAAMLDCDVVISALGPPLPPRNWPRPTTILRDGASATVEAMAAAGKRRLLIISGDVMFPGGGPMVTQSSGLDWTIVRPTRLTNGPLTGEYRAEAGVLPRRAKGISRADVAHFLLGAAERGDHVGQIVGLAR